MSAAERDMERGYTQKDMRDAQKWWNESPTDTAGLLRDLAMFLAKVRHEGFSRGYDEGLNDGLNK